MATPLEGPPPTTLGGQFRKHLPSYVAGAVALAVFQLSINRIDWLAKSAVDRIFSPTARSAWMPAVMMLGLAVVALIARVASRWILSRAGQRIEYELRNAVLAQLHRLGTAFYQKMSGGEIMSRATNDMEQVGLFLGFGMLNLIDTAFAFAATFQVMAVISWKLTLACLINVVTVLVSSRALIRRMYVRMNAYQSAMGRLSSVLQSNLVGVRVVRSFDIGQREQRRFDEINQEYLEASLSLARLRGSMAPLAGAATAIGITVLFWYGGILLLRGPAAGGLSKGDFFAFLIAYAQLAWPLVALGFCLTVVQRGRAGFARIREIFDAVPQVVDGPGPAPAEVVGALSVSTLSFSHGARKVLDGVSFEVPAGGSLAIVGPTGSGKSTLAMLLARMLPTPAGAVRIDGRDVCDLPLQALRSVVGYAQQDAFLFSTTVARNIGLALDHPDSAQAQERIRAAASEAQVTGDVLAFPAQFETLVGERGIQLSGGQKQRVALARALLREPRILVLDDPLSAVDAKTEAAILTAIERQAQHRTVVLITHRVAAAARCDQVIVLDHGRIVARGTHEELLRQQGLYAAFAEEQRAARELEDLATREPAA